MTNAELNTALYQKMFAEQETYREWLLSQPFGRNSEPHLWVHGSGDIWQTVADRAKSEVQKQKKKEDKER